MPRIISHLEAPARNTPSPAPVARRDSAVPPMTLSELIERYEATGGRFFTPSSMAWFASRIEDGFCFNDQAAYFVTSEKDKHRIPTTRRAYTVRQVFHDNSGYIRTVGNFNSIATRKRAIAMAENECAAMQQLINVDCRIG